MSANSSDVDVDKKRRNSAAKIAAFVEKRSGGKKTRGKGDFKVLSAAPPPELKILPSKQREARATAPPASAAGLAPKRDARQTAKVSPSPVDEEVQTRRRKSALLIQQAFKKHAERSTNYKVGEEPAEPNRAGKSPSSPSQSAEGHSSSSPGGSFRPRAFLVEEWVPPKGKGNHKDGPTQILRNLYVGNKEDAQNLSMLKRLNIKFIVNCTPNLPNYHEGQFAYYQIPVKDSEQSSLTPYFGPASTQILNYLQHKSPVLVHCIAGCSRSVSICAAVLISPPAPFRLSLKFALSHIKALRPIARPNASFMLQLCTHEAEINGGATSVLKARGLMFEDYPVKRFVQDSRSEGRYEMEVEVEPKSSLCVVL